MYTTSFTINIFRHFASTVNYLFQHDAHSKQQLFPYTAPKRPLFIIDTPRVFCGAEADFLNIIYVNFMLRVIN